VYIVVQKLLKFITKSTQKEILEKSLLNGLFQFATIATIKNIRKKMPTAQKSTNCTVSSVIR